jgi:hypothetical protein
MPFAARIAAITGGAIMRSAPLSTKPGAQNVPINAAFYASSCQKMPENTGIPRREASRITQNKGYLGRAS